MKGIVFIGDSYCYGEGLQYFSGLDTVYWPDTHVYDPSKITEMQVRFIEEHRYGRLVAKELGRLDLHFARNGGSNIQIITDIGNKIPDVYKYSEIDAVVVLLTNPLRDNFTFTHNGTVYKSLRLSSKDENDPIWMALLEYNASMYNGDFAKFENEIYSKHLELLEKEFRRFEENGLVCRWINYLEYGGDAIENFPYLKERLILIEENGKSYDSTRKWMMDNQKHFNRVHFSYTGKLTMDDHIGIEGHKVVAKSVVNNLKKVLK